MAQDWRNKEGASHYTRLCQQYRCQDSSFSPLKIIFNNRLSIWR